MSLPRATYTTVLFGTFAWCAALFLAPVFSLSSGPLHAAGGVLYTFFHPICHQLEERSFHVFGLPLAACARCSSIYLAFLLGTLVYPTFSHSLRPSRLLLAIAVSPMLLDVVTGMLGVHNVTNLTRAMTGAFFGAIIPFVIIPTAIEAVEQLLAGSTDPARSDRFAHHNT